MDKTEMTELLKSVAAGDVSPEEAALYGLEAEEAHF